MSTHTVDEIKKRLFGYECEGRENSERWRNPNASIKRQQGWNMGWKERPHNYYAEWEETKRPLTAGEVVQGRWAKISNLRTSQIVTCSATGHLNDQQLFEYAGNYGSWSIENGLLCFVTNGYTLYILGSLDGLHSGVEFAPGNDSEPFAYFKVIHVV